MSEKQQLYDEDGLPREMTDAEKNIERYKIKKLIKTLESARGMGTSVITVYIPPKGQISAVSTMLNNEFGTATNIKSHTNKLSVQGAITSALGRLKLINKVPPNGLMLFSGTVLTEDNKEKKLMLDIEPPKPVTRSLYMCDNKFHTQELHRMLESEDRFGFIIVDGNGTYYYSVCGAQKDKLGSFTVELPKKHGRGGQSKNRFARIRQERRHNYLRKVAEGATQHFISNNRPNVLGIVLAGSAEFKDSLFYSDLFDQRLKAIVVSIVDIAHSGEVGLNQAITMAGDTLGNVKIVQEKKLIGKLFDEIANDTQMYCFGMGDTMKAVEAGAVETLIIYEDLLYYRVVVKVVDGSSADEVYYLTEEEFKKKDFKKDSNNNNNNNINNKTTQIEIEKEEFVDWMTVNYNKMGLKLELVTDKSQEGTQFVKGFGGIGGMLRFKLDLMTLREHENVGINNNNNNNDEKKGSGDCVADYEDDFF